ncbi:MAG: M48 family metalloprotease [Roseomonas sp.]|nr:M48 family metalloprotease [Roseomonas sp.]
MIFDAVSSSWYGAARLLDLFGRTLTEHERSALNLFGLIGLTASLAAYQFRRLSHKLALRPLADVDERLHADANYVSQRLAAGRPRFLVSANVLDGNAFCLSMGRSPTIVLGGGLRLMLRKKRQQALAVIAHECGHVSAGDTFFLLITWYTFIAYTCVFIFNFALLQYFFWAKVPGAYAQWLEAGYDFWDFFRANFPIFLSNGILKIVEIVCVGVVLAHFIRQREFRADAVAAQAGWREPLTEALTERAADTHAQAWSLFARFHPRAAHRVVRLQDESTWGQIEFVFVAAMSFVMGRLIDQIPSSVAGFLRDIYKDMTEPEMHSLVMSVMVESTDFWQKAVSFLLFAYLGCLHVNRVSIVQSWNGYSFWMRLANGMAFVTASFAGFLLSTLLHENFLEDAARGTGVAFRLRTCLGAALAFALASGFFCSGAVVAANFMAKRAARSGLAQTARVVAITLLCAYLAGSLFIGLFFALVDSLNLHFLVIDFPHGNSESMRLPTLMGYFVFVAGFLVLFAAMKLDRRRVTPKLHPSWLVRDEVPNPP